MVAVNTLEQCIVNEFLPFHIKEVDDDVIKEILLNPSKSLPVLYREHPTPQNHRLYLVNFDEGKKRKMDYGKGHLVKFPGFRSSCLEDGDLMKRISTRVPLGEDQSFVVREFRIKGDEKGLSLFFVEVSNFLVKPRKGGSNSNKENKPKKRQRITHGSKKKLPTTHNTPHNVLFSSSQNPPFHFQPLNSPSPFTPSSLFSSLHPQTYYEHITTFYSSNENSDNLIFNNSNSSNNIFDENNLNDFTLSSPSSFGSDISSPESEDDCDLSHYLNINL